MAQDAKRSYHRTTIYVTDEQWRWLSRLAAQARLDELSLSASDVIRLASPGSKTSSPTTTTCVPS